MELFEKKEQCCGCSACYNICPKGAITMGEDEYGFMYPLINEKLCVQCGLCKKVCNFQKEQDERRPIESFVAFDQDEQQIRASASGGVFASVADCFLQQEGIVYGSSMEQEDGKLIPRHIRIQRTEELTKIQGSKYVQSEIGDTYKNILKDLKEGKKVLFSGTPCQVDGLNGYLQKPYDNLFTIDIICHGVPNKKMFQDYLAYLGKSKKGNVKEFLFRDKTSGWGLNAKYVYDKDGRKKTEVLPNYLSSYYVLFLRSMIYRENCYKCKYASSNRVGDLTIGDYWGIEEQHPELVDGTKNSLDTKKGISCLIINSEQGKRLVDIYGDKLERYDSQYDKVAAQNEQLNRPSDRPKEREEILELYRVGGYAKVEKYFNATYNKKTIKDQIKAMVPKRIKRMLKRNSN